MRPHNNEAPSNGSQAIAHLLRHPKLRRRTAPEQVGRGRSNDSEVGLEGSRSRSDLRLAQSIELAVKQNDFVPCPLQQSFRIAEFKREMRFATSEIDAAVE